MGAEYAYFILFYSPLPPSLLPDLLTYLSTYLSNLLFRIGSKVIYY